MDSTTQAFKEEAYELLGELEHALLELEADPEDQSLIDRVFRAMHTIKGSGAMFGFDDIASFTHEVETVFDKVRTGAMAVTKELLDLTLAARDHIAHLLAVAEGEQELDLARSGELVAAFKRLYGPPQPVAEAPSLAAPAEAVTYRIRFKPNEEIYFSGNDPVALLRELMDLGQGVVFPHVDAIPNLESLDPRLCHAWWDVVLGTSAPAQALSEVFLFVEDESVVDVSIIDRHGGLDADAAHKMLGEILVERGDITEADLHRVLGDKKRIGDILAESGLVSPHQIKAALAEQNAVREIRKHRAEKHFETDAATSIRVAANKLDSLVDLVGELVIVQAQISQAAMERNDPGLVVLSEQLERLSDELRDSTLGIRMLPIGTTFSKFRRLVRDLSDELGKKIELSTQGAETELDKTVIERLSDPLVHLLRNSIDHGIETPAERVAAGKPEEGSILLEAEHSGGEVLIRIKDDGKGIDKDAVRAKAVERGLIAPDAELNDREVFAQIFQPGFSTAASVTSVSGRGVGMDVVKRSIDQLRGSVLIESRKGEGTTITVKLPLTLAIIDGLQVQVGDDFFVIPLTHVEECVELSREAEVDSAKRFVILRGEIVPYVRVRDVFAVPGAPPSIEQIVIVGVQGSRVGVVVDHVVGEHQTVIKSLGRVYRDVEGISGATIKGDGALALILDVPRLVHLAERDSGVRLH
ncbi:MAG: chemotaxis protein CheW [Desulfovibrionaceae bacterium]